MKNMNDKTKKRVVLACGLVISVALVVMIGARFTKAPVTEEVNKCCSANYMSLKLSN